MTDEEEAAGAAQDSEDASRSILADRGDQRAEALVYAVLACSAGLEALYHQRERHRAA